MSEADLAEWFRSNVRRTIGLAGANCDDTTDRTRAAPNEAGAQPARFQLHRVQDHMGGKLREKIIAGRDGGGDLDLVPGSGVIEILAQAGFDYLLLDGEHARKSIPSELVPLPSPPSGAAVRSSTGAGQQPPI